MPGGKGRGPEAGGYEGCVARMQQTALEPAKYGGLVAIAEIGRDDSDQVVTLAAERTGKIVGTISKFPRRLGNTLPCFLRKARRLGDVVENHRDGRSRQAEMFGQ